MIRRDCWDPIPCGLRDMEPPMFPATGKATAVHCQFSSPSRWRKAPPEGEDRASTPKRTTLLLPSAAGIVREVPRSPGTSNRHSGVLQA